jgi:hypothetical protein
MNAKSLQQLLDEIDEIVARAETTSDLQQRIKLLEKALFLACRYTKTLNRQIGTVIQNVLEWGRFDESRATIPLRDIAQSDPQLEVFRHKDILKEFLSAGRGLLRNQMGISEKAIDELIGNIDRSYELFMDEKMSSQPLLENFRRLEDFFCRPPGGPGGPLAGPNPPSDAPGGVALKRMSKVAEILESFSKILGFLTGVFGKSLGNHSLREEKPIQVSEFPYPYQVLALLLVAALRQGLENDQEIPEARVTPQVPAFAGA